MVQPPERVFFDVAKEVYSLDAKPEVDGFRLAKDTPTIDAYVSDETKTIVIGIRGTNLSDVNDILADIRTITSRLTTTTRYQYDKAFVQKIFREFPGYSVFLAGHSLGGAMATQLKRDFPQIKTAITFNPAFQSKDLASSPPNIVRIYSSRDPLYLLGGRMIASRVIQADTLNPLKAHFLDIFNKYYANQPRETSGQRNLRKFRENGNHFRPQANPLAQSSPAVPSVSEPVQSSSSVVPEVASLSQQTL